MRLPLLALVMLAACWQTTAELTGAAPDDEDPSAPGARGCELDEDCVPAGATCCDCPTFAVLASDPLARSCTGVMCPDDQCPQNIEAKCEAGACVLACAPLACTGGDGSATVCADGFALDENGCLTCECAGAPLGGCSADTDCVQTRADCCGCERGGHDTAVLAEDRAGFDVALDCPPEPQCPSVNSCTSGETPQCVAGRCELLPAPPAGACGRPDLPACPAGTVCTVNASDPANMHGVGVCVAS